MYPGVNLTRVNGQNVFEKTSYRCLEKAVWPCFGNIVVGKYILRMHAMHVFCPDEKSSGPVPSFWIYVACAACGSPCLLTFERSHCFRL